jgi:hypothetical protein
MIGAAVVALDVLVLGDHLGIGRLLNLQRIGQQRQAGGELLTQFGPGGPIEKLLGASIPRGAKPTFTRLPPTPSGRISPQQFRQMLGTPGR